jgi:hypothetical protein
MNGSVVGKGKVKFHPTTSHEIPEREHGYKSTLSLTSALDGVGGQRHAPTTLPPGKTRYPLYRRLGGSQGRSGRLRKISRPAGFDPRTVQPLASRYTDYAIPAPQCCRYCCKISSPLKANVILYFLILQTQKNEHKSI